ncbi:unnamed protein product [Closterium sp. NIES-54]
MPSKRSGRRGVPSSSNAMASSSLCTPSLGPHVWHAEPSKQQQQQQQPRLLPPCLHEEVAESDDPCDLTAPARVTCATAANAASVNVGTAATAANAASVDYSQLSVVDRSQQASFFAQERRENLESRVESRSQPLESFFFGGGCGVSVLHGVDCGPVDHLFPVHVSAAAEERFCGFGGATAGDLGLCALPPAASCGIDAEHVQEVTPLAVLETIRALPGLAGGPSVPHRPMSRGAKAAVARVMMRRRAAEQQQQKRLQQEEQQGSDGGVVVKAVEMACPRGPFAVYKQSLGTPLVGGWEEARGVAEDAGKMEAEVVEEGRQGPDTGRFVGGAPAARDLAAMAAVAGTKSADESPQSAGTKRARELGVAEAIPPVSKAARGLWEVVACRERALADAADAIDPADVVTVMDAIDAIGSIGAMDLVQAVDAQAEVAASGVLGAGGVDEAVRGELEWFEGAEFGACMGSLFGGKADGTCAGQCVCCGGVKNAWTGCHDFTMAGVAGLSDDVTSQA